MNVLFFGLAGSGKSTLISNLKGKKVNLDPGAIYVPYKPDVNVRELVKLEEIMMREKIGPNYAFIRAFEEISKKFAIEDSDEITLIDMPGQFEVYFNFDFDFIKGKKVGVYLMDSKRDLNLKNFLMDNLIYTMLTLKFDFKILRVFTKEDLLSEEEKGKLVEWSMGAIFEIELEDEIFENIREIIQKYFIKQEPIFVNAKDERSCSKLLELLLNLSR